VCVFTDLSSSTNGMTACQKRCYHCIRERDDSTYRVRLALHFPGLCLRTRWPLQKSPRNMLHIFHRLLLDRGCETVTRSTPSFFHPHRSGSRSFLNIFVSESPASKCGKYETKLSSAQRRVISASRTSDILHFTVCDDVQRSAIESASPTITVEHD
jgi:hypothetical protein